MQLTRFELLKSRSEKNLELIRSLTFGIPNQNIVVGSSCFVLNIISIFLNA